MSNRTLLLYYVDENPINPTIINDPNGFGERGFLPHGINQPYLNEILLVVENMGDKKFPSLDYNARVFLAQALVHVRPEAYSIEASITGTIKIFSKEIIKRLKKLP